ncbi:fibronectin type III domain-containing protein [Streptomyces sp. NPDC053079]|uniref:fibronectin type III domain-containing protein n=1 Tax=Streptomyces sp. NPDC053079 TaxID=3365697 RepID=UPI0037CEA5EB
MRDTDEFSHTEKTFDFEKKVTLRHGDKPVILRISKCAGGEVRGVLDVLVQLDRFDVIHAGPNLKLYEGDSCTSKDLDGERSYLNSRIPLGETRNWETWVVNGEYLSPDLVRAKWTVTHDGPPKPPSNVKVTTPSTRLICAVLGVPCKQKSVFLTWNDNANNETAYEVRNVTLDRTMLAPQNSTKFTWPGLDRQVNYCFQVRAVNSLGASAWSPTFSLAAAVVLGARRACA